MFNIVDVNLSKIECYHYKKKYYKTNCFDLKQMTKIVNNKIFKTKND